MTLILGIGDSELPWGKSGGVTPADVTRVCNEVAQVGATSIRMSAAWGLTDPNNTGNPNKFKWTDLDTAINAAEAAGLDVLLICEPRRFSFWNLFGIPTAVSVTPTNIKNYGKFCGAIAQRYADRDVIKQFEIGNEVNNKAYFASPKDPSKYIDFLRSAHDNITTYIPDATILAGALQAVATDPYITQASLHPVEWVKKFYDCDPQEWFTGLSMHPYSTGGHFDPMTPTPDNEYAFKNIEAIREVMDANGDTDKLIYCTEWGYDSVRSLTGISDSVDELEAEQALNVQTHWNILDGYAASGMIYPTTWVYNYRNNKAGDDDPAYSFGAVRYDYTRKPVWTFLQSLGGGIEADIPTIEAPAEVLIPVVDVIEDLSRPNIPTVEAGAEVLAPTGIFPAEIPTVEAGATVIIPAVDTITPDVVFASKGTGDLDTTTGLEVFLTWTHVVAATSDAALLTGLTVSTDHLKAWENYNTLTVSSDLDGSLTRLASRHLGASSVKKGSLHAFGLANVDGSIKRPTVGTHTITAHVKLNNDFVTNLTSVCGNSFLYQGVSAYGTVASNGNGSGTPNVTCPSAVGDRVFFVFACSNDLFDHFNRSTRYHDGASVDGDSDYTLCGDGAGAAPSLAGSCALSFVRYGAIAINLET